MPSRKDLFDRMRTMIQKDGRCPTAIFDLFTADEKFDLNRSMLHGSDRQKAFLTWMIVSNGAPLPATVKKRLPAPQAYMIEQQLQMYRTQIERQQDWVRRQHSNSQDARKSRNRGAIS